MLRQSTQSRKPYEDPSVVSMDVFGQVYPVRVEEKGVTFPWVARSSTHELSVEGSSRHQALANLHLAIRALIHMQARVSS